MNLVKAETSRFASRRFIQIMLLLLVVAFGLTIFTVLASSEPATDEMWRQAREQAATDRREYANQYQSCLLQIQDRQRCETFNPDRVVDEDYLYGVFHFGRQIAPLIYFLGAFLSLFGYLVMASFIGSELHSGSMTNLLLWRPNRFAVLGSKLGVGLGLIAAISTIFTVVYVGTFWLIASVTGHTGGLTPDSWRDIGVLGLRAIGMAIFASTVAFAIATVGRHTAAALGALLGYVIVWEGGARLIFELIGSGSGADPLFMSTYIGAWFSGSYAYYAYSGDYGIGSHHTIYFWQSAILFAVLSVATTAIAFTTFRRRDLM